MNVLIAAPTGYVGRRLVARFEREAGARVRVFLRDARRIRPDLHPSTDVVEADRFDLPALRRAVRDIDVAYFPIRFASLERGFDARLGEFARMFGDSCLEAGVRRIIHVGSRSVPDFSGGTASVRPGFTEILCAGPEKTQIIGLFPGVIIGPGSVVYEMVMSLGGRFPFLLLPRWMGAEVEPVALSDLIEYLVRAATVEADGHLMLDVGEERMAMTELLRLATRVRGMPRPMIPIPVVAPRLSAFLLMLATPFSYPLCSAMVRHLESSRTAPPERPREAARQHFPDLTPLSCEQALEEALAASEADQVTGRWTDSLAGIPYDRAETEMGRARYRDVRRHDFGTLPPEKVFVSVLALGGEKGWFNFDLLWRARGLMDKLLGGFGTSLGRRSPTDLRIGDLLDVWRVVDLVENRRLLLRAQMKVFGEAWLEFRLQGTELIQTAYFHPDGALGRLYWYAMLPFHAFIFPDMARSIVRRARGL